MNITLAGQGAIDDTLDAELTKVIVDPLEAELTEAIHYIQASIRSRINGKALPVSTLPPPMYRGQIEIDPVSGEVKTQLAGMFRHYDTSLQSFKRADTLEVLFRIEAHVDAEAKRLGIPVNDLNTTMINRSTVTEYPVRISVLRTEMLDRFEDNPALNFENLKDYMNIVDNFLQPNLDIGVSDEVKGIYDKFARNLLTEVYGFCVNNWGEGLQEKTSMTESDMREYFYKYNLSLPVVVLPKEVGFMVQDGGRQTQLVVDHTTNGVEQAA